MGIIIVVIIMFIITLNWPKPPRSLLPPRERPEVPNCRIVHPPIGNVSWVYTVVRQLSFTLLMRAVYNRWERTNLLCTYNRWERAREWTQTDYEPRRQCHLQVVWRQSVSEWVSDACWGGRGPEHGDSRWHLWYVDHCTLIICFKNGCTGTCGFPSGIICWTLNAAEKIGVSHAQGWRGTHREV